MRALRRRYGRAALSGEMWGGERAQMGPYRAYRVVTNDLVEENVVDWQGTKRVRADKEFEAAVLAARKSSKRRGRTLVQIMGQEDAHTWRILQTYDTLVHGV